MGENRAQELEAKAAAVPGRFTWDFIGQLQSRKVKDVLPHVRYIHSVASDSALAQLGRHGGPETEVLIEVNVAGEAGKSGIAPDELPAFLDRCPVSVVGLMTMPPFTADPEDSRPAFRGAAAAGRRPTGCPSCRWGPARTTSSRRRRGRRSCASVRACSAIAAERVIITGRESPQMREP